MTAGIERKACGVCRDANVPHWPHAGPNDLHWRVVCMRCGRYEITDSYYALLERQPLSRRQAANASRWIRTNPEVVLTHFHHAMLTSLPTPSVGRKAELFMRYVIENYPDIGTNFAFLLFVVEQDIAAPSKDEVEFIAKHLIDSGYLSGTVIDGKIHASITPRGWEYVESLDRHAAESPFAYVAMRFNDETNALRDEGIRPAIIAAGWDARLIDEVHHLNHIDDEIIAAIRRSRFLVADLTGQRPNVYYEAGYAQGLGAPVVWTCREDEVEANAVHFDIRQYAFITWRMDTLNDFRRRLTARIVATVGQGPVPAA
jgi:hypothetical protein